MIGWKALGDMLEVRGPRWLVYGTIRRDEFSARYADTAQQAERIREELAATRHRSIKVHPPVGSIDLAALGRDRQEARRVAEEKTALLRAGVLQALEEGRDETEVAQTAGVDRQTVRAWAGKQPSNRRQVG